jgi:uracil-DNA glycosylase
MKKLLQQIHECTVCQKYLAAGVRPIVAADPKSKIIIIGQAPGITYATGWALPKKSFIIRVSLL